MHQAVVTSFFASSRRFGFSSGLRRLGMVTALMLATAATGLAQEIWRLDNTRRIGGLRVRLVGDPQMAEVAGTRTVTFNGASEGLFFDVNPLEGAKAFTVEVLIAPAVDGPEAQRFFHVEDTAGRRGLLELRRNEKGWWLDAFLRSGRGLDDRGLVLIDPTQVHPLGQWHWVAMRYDGKRLYSYVNGVKQLEGEYSFPPMKAGKVSLGVRQNLVSWFKGGLREVRFHHEAIPEEKLMRVFAPRKPRFGE